MAPKWIDTLELSEESKAALRAYESAQQAAVESARAQQALEQAVITVPDKELGAFADLCKSLDLNRQNH